MGIARKITGNFGSRFLSPAIFQVYIKNFPINLWSHSTNLFRLLKAFISSLKALNYVSRNWIGKIPNEEKNVSLKLIR